MPAQQDSLRFLMLNHNRQGVGSFYRCWHLARGLSDLGHRVTIVTVSPTHRLRPTVSRQRGLMIIETPNLLDLVYGVGSGFGILGIPYRAVLAARAEFDVVHAFDHKPNVLIPALLGSTLNDVPWIADWADWWGFTRDGSGLQERRRWPIPQMENAAEEFAHRRADWVTTISTGLRERAISLAIPPERATWIPSGAPSDLIQPEEKGSCRRALELPADSFLLGYVGSEMGDVDLLIPFVRSLRAKHSAVRLALIGPKYRHGRLSDAEARGDIINFGGVPFSKLSTYLGACDAFILPLRDTVFNRTRWPNKFGDYLAAGRPILSSDVGDVARIVAEEQCGMVWRDLQDLSDAAVTLLEDDSVSQEMGARARQVAENRLSWRTLVPQFVSVYRQLLRAG